MAIRHYLWLPCPASRSRTHPPYGNRSRAICPEKSTGVPELLRGHLQRGTGLLQQANCEVNALLLGCGKAVPPLFELIGELDFPRQVQLCHMRHYVVNGMNPPWSNGMAARSDARVLLIGESGTGKELLAAH